MSFILSLTLKFPSLLLHVPGALPKGAGSHMSSTWARWAETGNRSSQGPAQQATARVVSFEVVTAVVVFCTMTRWWDKMRPPKHCLALRSVGSLSWELKDEEEHPSSFFSYSSGLFAAGSEQAALAARGHRSKVCESWGQKKGRSQTERIIHSSGHSVGHGESG